MSSTDVALLKTLIDRTPSPLGATMTVKQKLKQFGKDQFMLLQSSIDPSLVLFRGDAISAHSLLDWSSVLEQQSDALMLKGRGGADFLKRLFEGINGFPNDLDLVDDRRRLVKDGLLRVYDDSTSTWPYLQV